MRSTSSASPHLTPLKASRPAKRQARSQHLFPYDSTCSIRPSALRHRKRSVCSVEPPTPPSLRSSSPYTQELPRGRSLDRSPPPLRLTLENLQFFEQSAYSSSQMSSLRNPSPTRKDAAIADKKRLAGYNITVDNGVALPKTLADFVRTLEQSRDQEP